MSRELKERVKAVFICFQPPPRIYLSPASKQAGYDKSNRLSGFSVEAISFVGSKMSVGAMGDSYYEYLLKLWIQGGKKEVRLKEAWKKAMTQMMDQMAGSLKKTA